MSTGIITVLEDGLRESPLHSKHLPQFSPGVLPYLIRIGVGFDQLDGPARVRLILADVDPQVLDINCR